MDEAGNEATPDHRFARAKTLQEFLADADEGNDRDGIAKCQHTGLLRGHIAAELHQLKRHDHGCRSQPLSRKFEIVAPVNVGLLNSVKSTKAAGVRPSMRKNRIPNITVTAMRMSA